MSSEQAVDAIIRELDKRTLLGAAYDCMSEVGKQRLRESLQQIVEETKEP